jgi:RNA polymerase sigma-70 factor, ECF subfamily
LQKDFEDQLRPLWLRAQAGDEVAYRQALGLASDRLRGFFSRRMIGMSHEVEDLVQETLLALHLQRGTYDAGIPVTAWVHGIARHKLVDLWRRQGRGERMFESFDDLPEALHPVVHDEAEARRDLGLLLQALPAAQRQSIVDTKLEGLSVTNAALREGVSESAVKVNVHRGLKRLAKLIRGTP